MIKRIVLATAILAFSAFQGQTEDVPYEDWQHANVEGELISHPDRIIRKAGEVIRFRIAVTDLTRSIPAGDYVRTDVSAADIWRNGEVSSNVDFGFVCETVGAGIPVGGGLTCSGSYTVKQVDIDAGELMLVFGVGLSTRNFDLWGGSVMENFEVEEVTEPETPMPDDDEKKTCKPMPLAANGAKFVFRYQPASVCL